MATLRGSATPSSGLVKQLVLVLAGALLGTFLAPVAARATGQLMSIVDTNDADVALVDGGKLRVGDGSGNLTVDGTVTTLYGTPSGQSALSFTLTGGERRAIAGPVSASGRILISSITYFGANTSDVLPALEVRDAVNGSCSSSGTLRSARVMAELGSNQTVHLVYPELLVAPFGGSTPNSWCLYAQTSIAHRMLIVLRFA